MNSVKEIVEWAASDLSDWEADIVRRLLLNKTLPTQDLKEVIDNVFITYGIAEHNEKKICSVPTTNSEIAGEIVASVSVRLCNIHNAQNINAISSESKLPFSHNGITLIYGENGSGKSGYTRVLKNACFAKHTEPEILPNVYKQDTGPQSAIITFIKNGEKQQWEWSPGKTLADLAGINVYDSDCGKVLLEKNNQVTYKPKGVEIFDGVSAIAEAIREAASKKMRNSKLPIIQEIEKIPALSKWLASINENTTSVTIDSKLIWTEENKSELNQLNTSIQDYQNGTATKKIEKLKDISENRVPRAITKLTNCLSILSSDKSEHVKKLEFAVNTTKIAYDISVKGFDTEEPLAGTHTEAWKQLFNAAKYFSEQYTYIGESYPKVDDGSKCVLCMQPLSDDAKRRMSRFDAYIKDKSKTQYEQAVKLLADTRLAIQNLIVPDLEAYEPLCNDLLELTGTDHGLAAAFEIAKQRKEYFNTFGASSFPLGDIDTMQISANLTNSLAQKITELRATNSEETNKLNLLRQTELLVQYRLYEAKDQIVQHHRNLIFNKRVSEAIGALRNTKQKFSSKAKSFISKLVTPEFVQNFSRELKFLGVTLDVKISAVVKDIDTSHSFTIATKRPGRILSEGEQKVISIAAFLAEIATFKNSEAIILDDPVSSLDHVYREKIAHRLAIEALERQVIIFTHDLSLIMEIEGKCEDISLEQGQGPARSVFTIRRSGKDSGFCYTKAPWRGMTTAQRAQNLDEDVHAIKSLYESDAHSYNQKAAFIYCLLREAWEALVEQDLLCQIVTRGRNSVQTLRLGQLSILPTDANTITQNMTKTSNWMFGHDKSKALSENRPAPTELLQDIASLRAFAKEVSARKKTTEKTFEDQFKSPISEVG
ncbi:AAA family ATPase [Pseudomonas sp. CFBP 13602]|uniref:AAA family ATPase n=1 Tax=Pseudomonas sp. CFBP 13602 TaxID=2774039 RepID=UPI00177D7A78|nr:AAA family ATPase [Pseudomonas sp. CFBP 13602]MBD8825730.1 AAA family ATPase [Pseudomonas sp. CFBP 13602]